MISGRALRYFDTVAQCHSLRQAAAQLHIAPTAISRQIDLLEHQLGAPLIERGPNGISLTAAGELLAAQAQRTLRDLERVQEHIADLKGLRTGRVSLQVAEGVVAGLLAPALANMGLRYPHLRFDIGTASASHMVEALRRGDADIVCVRRSSELPIIKGWRWHLPSRPLPWKPRKPSRLTVRACSSFRRWPWRVSVSQVSW